MVKCSSCGKKFATRAALQQHVAASHPTGALPVQHKKGGPVTQDRLVKLYGEEGLRELMGLTEDGKDYAMKACDPAGPGRVPEGVPDSTAGNSLTMEARLTANIGSITTGDETWDLAILAVPDPQLGFCAWRRSKSTPTWQAIEPGLAAGNYAAFAWSDDGAQGAGTLRSTFHAWRVMYSSLTCVLNASATTDQGHVFAGQLVPTITETVATPDSGFGRRNRVIDHGVWEATNLVARDPTAFCSAARDGCYVVQKQTEPTLVWNDVHDSEVSGTSNDTWELWSPPGGNVNACKGALPDVPSYGQSHASAVVVFQGLDAHASVQVKAIRGIEAKVRGTGLAPSFATPPPLLDRRALDAVVVVQSRMASAYPASYNSLGSILKTIWGIATKYVAPMLSALAPVAPRIGMVGQIIRGVDNIVHPAEVRKPAR